MLTLIGEVIYHRRIGRKDEGVQQIRPLDLSGIANQTLSTKVHPSIPPYIETFKSVSDDKIQIKKGVILGGHKFVAASKKNKTIIGTLSAKPTYDYVD